MDALQYPLIDLLDCPLYMWTNWYKGFSLVSKGRNTKYSLHTTQDSDGSLPNMSILDMQRLSPEVLTWPTGKS